MRQSPLRHNMADVLGLSYLLPISLCRNTSLWHLPTEITDQFGVGWKHIMYFHDNYCCWFQAYNGHLDALNILTCYINNLDMKDDRGT